MDTQPIQILLVEDNAADAASLTLEFSQSPFGPFSIARAARLADAMDLVQREGLDAVVLDLGLPDSQGLETLRALRRRKPPELPVIVMTGMLDTTLCLRAVQEGADDYLIKGAADSVGARSVRYAVERRRASELSRALQLRNAELEAANNELESFSYSVSHDLRAPLRILDGFSVVLLEDYGGKMDAEGLNCLTRIRAASQRMGHLIDDLLNLSKVSRAEMSRERVDISRIAGEVAGELQRSEPGRSAKFVIAENLTAQSDSWLIRIALANLLGNAWKFTGKCAQARIEFGSSSERGGPDAYFVRDNGAGFDMRYAEKLFGAFQRLHRVEEFPGTGIGLATVQRIVRRHGGRVWAEGKPGAGATFHFTLEPEWIKPEPSMNLRRQGVGADPESL